MRSRPAWPPLLVCRGFEAWVAYALAVLAHELQGRACVVRERETWATLARVAGSTMRCHCGVRAAEAHLWSAERSQEPDESAPGGQGSESCGTAETVL